MQKLEKTAQAWALTAWRLRNGEVVYRRPDGLWGEQFAEAEVLRAKEDADAALQKALGDAKAQMVIGPYLFEIADPDGEPMPASVRERIRAKGPTVRQDLGKQAARP